jgi:uncharacterized protein YbbC (DUF1343 family)
LATWLGVLQVIGQMSAFEWNDHFERLIGVAGVRQAIQRGATVSEMMVGWAEFCRQFEQDRKPYLLYS